MAQAGSEKAVSSGRISAADVAAMTFDAIRENRFYVFTHPQIMPSVEARFAAVLGGAAPADPYATRPTTRPSIARMIRTGQYAHLDNGIRLHYASVGDPRARPILFLHGFPGVLGRVGRRAAVLRRGWHAVAPDLRGFNLSSQPTDVAAYRVRELVGRLRDASVTRGWAWSGSWSPTTGAARPHGSGRSRTRSASKLIILNSPHPIPFARDTGRRSRAAGAPGLHELAARAGRRGSAGEARLRPAREFFLGMQRPDAPGTRTNAAARYHAVWARGLTGALNYYRASPLIPRRTTTPGATALQLEPAHFRVRVPTLVIWGEADTALPVTPARRPDELVDDLTVDRLPRATHWLAHEEPDAVAAAIHDFCQPADPSRIRCRRRTARCRWQNLRTKFTETHQ